MPVCFDGRHDMCRQQDAVQGSFVSVQINEVASKKNVSRKE
jgi:hypothetical protein